MKVENTQAQMRKGILEYCILSILENNSVYASDIIKELKMAKVIVSTRSYKRSHNKAPRGYGMWAFEINRKEYFITGNFADARKEAVKVAKEEKAGVVCVMP